LLIRSVCGDIESTLLDLLDTETLSWERDALLIYLLVRMSGEDPSPRLIAAVRNASRRDAGLPSRILLGLAARLLDNREVDKVAATNIALADEFETGANRYNQLLEKPILELLPEKAPPKVISSGKTLCRRGAKIQRNDPCHCGSGKKYKKCCMDKDAAGADNGSPIWEDAPEKTMTPQQFSALRPQQLIGMDYESLPVKYLVSAFNTLLNYNRWQEVARILDILAGRDDLPLGGVIDDYRNDAIHHALIQGEVEFARQQQALMETPVDEAVQLKFDLVEPSVDILEKLEDFAIRLLNARSTQDEGMEIYLRKCLQETYPLLFEYMKACL
jgi:hypothetical protein